MIISNIFKYILNIIFINVINQKNNKNFRMKLSFEELHKQKKKKIKI